MKTRVVPLLAVLVFAVTLPAAAENFTREMALPTDVLRVADMIGAVAVGASPDTAFHVKVEVKGEDATPDLIRIEQDDGAVRVVFPVERHRRYVYPHLTGKKASFHRGMGSDQDTWWQRILRKAGGSRIQVHRHGRGFRAWADVTVLVPAGAHLDVVHGAGLVVVEGVDGKITCELRSGPVTIKRLRGAFHGGTDSGRVTCEDITGDLHLDTGSGSIRVKRCRGDHLHADTGSGGVTLDDVNVSLLEVDTGSGPVTGKHVGADEARIETGSGSITMEFVRLGSDWFRLETGSGGIDLSLPADISATITAETGSGGVTWELPGARVEHREDDAVRLVLGDGIAHLKLATGSGGIRIHH